VAKVWQNVIVIASARTVDVLVKRQNFYAIRVAIQAIKTAKINRKINK
jgi:hypothetical protein